MAAPIILDDALVDCDDDRIQRMFDALSRAGKNQQIIVLTCRQPRSSRVGLDGGSATCGDGASMAAVCGSAGSGVNGSGLSLGTLSAFRYRMYSQRRR
jgi:hypothetical protein